MLIMTLDFDHVDASTLTWPICVAADHLSAIVVVCQVVADLHMVTPKICALVAFTLYSPFALQNFILHSKRMVRVMVSGRRTGRRTACSLKVMYHLSFSCDSYFVSSFVV